MNFFFGGGSALFQHFYFRPHRRFELLVMLVCLWLLSWPMPVDGAHSVCPTCFGNAASCTFEVNGQCPVSKALNENVSTVRVVTTAATLAAGTAFTLMGVVSLRFLRMFNAGSLALLLRLLAKPASGTQFVLTTTTKVSAAFTAVRNGQTTVEQLVVGYAELADDETDPTLQATLRERYKMVCEARDMGLAAATAGPSEQEGHWTYLWAKVAHFVVTRGMETAVTLADSPVKPLTSDKVIIKAFADEVEFMEALNLFGLFTTALGLVSAPVLGEFLESFVFDTIRLRGYTWQFTAEFLFVVLRHIEDSVGRLTMVNAIHLVHLNTLLQEAEAAAARRYPGAPLHRRQEAILAAQQWNGEDTPGSTLLCIAFNEGLEHKDSNLKPDGTCRFSHRCNQWVTDKGPGGVCGGSHSRMECDNVNKTGGPSLV